MKLRRSELLELAEAWLVTARAEWTAGIVASEARIAHGRKIDITQLRGLLDKQFETLMRRITSCSMPPAPRTRAKRRKSGSGK